MQIHVCPAKGQARCFVTACFWVDSKCSEPHIEAPCMGTPLPRIHPFIFKDAMFLKLKVDMWVK